MIDHHDRPDQSQTPSAPANDDAGDALERDDIQEAQDQAGIAGEPQPAETEPTDTQSAEELNDEPTSPPGYGGG